MENNLSGDTSADTEALRNSTAALILAAMYTHHVVSQPRNATASQEQERRLNILRMERAAEALAAADAFVAELSTRVTYADLFLKDSDRIDPRALDPHCAHGVKIADPCPECEKSPPILGTGGDAA